MIGDQEENQRRYAEIGASCACLSVRRAARAVTQLYDEVLRPCGLRATQLTLLTAIAAVGQAQVSSLSEALVTDRTTLTRNLDVLEQRGLARRFAGQDRRARMVTLTPAGHAALEDALPLWAEAQRRLGQQLGQTRWGELQRALSALVDSVH